MSLQCLKGHRSLGSLFHQITCNAIEFHQIPSNTSKCHVIPSNTIRYHGATSISDGVFWYGGFEKTADLWRVLPTRVPCSARCQSLKRKKLSWGKRGTSSVSGWSANSGQHKTCVTGVFLTQTFRLMTSAECDRKVCEFWSWSTSPTTPTTTTYNDKDDEKGRKTLKLDE